MRVFTVKAFGRFQRREKITDAMLCTALDNACRGLIDAELGGEVIKQRVARKGQGKSGGYRVLVAFRSGKRAVFLYGAQALCPGLAGARRREDCACHRRWGPAGGVL